MKKRNLVLIALVFALIICATIQPAMAYFTTYVRAKGGHEVTFGDTTEITEKYSNFLKEVTIRNKDDSYPVFIRAKVLYEGKFEIAVSGTGWTAKQDDGYYYYGSNSSTDHRTVTHTILNGGQSTNGPLCVEIQNVPPVTIKDENNKDIPNPAFQRLTEGERSFSVVVVYESTPVRYDENNNPEAEWDKDIIEIGSTSSTTGGNP